MIHELELSGYSKVKDCHANIFSQYFLAYKGSDVKARLSRRLKALPASVQGRIRKYGHFEVRLNGHLCSVCIGDAGYLFPEAYGRSKANIVFITQVKDRYQRKLQKIYQETGHRIYPIPLPLLHHCEEIANGHTYQFNKKEYVSQMSFSVHGRLHRKPWIRLAKEHPDQFDMQSINDSKEYCEYVTNKISWGVSLKGHGKDGKCYKECELMYMGVPMALSYRPFYPFPFKAGEHYVRLKRPKDLLRLKGIDPKPFAEKSKELGEKYIRQPRYLDLMMKCIEQEEYDPVVIKE